ncbi:dihydropteroate synthase [Escherichia coli]|uniref:dihydropteroate synthase n=1 Tax=Escherichia coli TaxID=562 RepID=UPI003EE40A42
MLRGFFLSIYTRDNTLQFFFNANFRRPRACGLATNVNDRRASVDHQIRMFHRIYQRVSVEEELQRVIPVVEAIAQRFEVWISVDTSKPEVIRESAKVGAHIINDIRSLSEPGALEAAAETGLPVCLMHMQGNPKTMQEAPKYDDVFAEVNRYFIEQIARCEQAGIAKEKLLLDPGFGFGKNLSHNYSLLARLAEFHHFNLPLLVGMSRKSMIGQLLNVGPSERLSGSLACAVIAAMQGAHIIRVHDVKETVEAMRVVEATLSAKENKRYE